MNNYEYIKSDNKLNYEVPIRDVYSEAEEIAKKILCSYNPAEANILLNTTREILAEKITIELKELRNRISILENDLKIMQNKTNE